MTFRAPIQFAKQLFVFYNIAQDRIKYGKSFALHLRDVRTTRISCEVLSRVAATATEL